ncbi:unnamed protein product [Mortierella alpina]
MAACLAARARSALAAVAATARVTATPLSHTPVASNAVRLALNLKPFQQPHVLCRGLHSSPSTFRNKPSSWGDLIPQPSNRNTDGNPLSKIIVRPEYKRFGQKPGRGGEEVFLSFTTGAIKSLAVLSLSELEDIISRIWKLPMTGRRRFMDVSTSQEEMMAKEAYKQVMREYQNNVLPQNHPYTLYVKRVAQRIIQAAGMQNLDWEFHVIHSDEKNAFVLPGGKVFVFTGILPIAENENGLATVLGHEIAHQLARHSAEKLSFTKIALFLGVIVALVFDPSWSTQRIIMDLGMMLPFSRKCETEADQIGLQLIAQACFDPRESTRMWARMSAQERGPNLSFLNTHPSSKDRIVKMQQWMPEALETWHKSDCATTNAYADMFNKSRLASW